ncbi:hypothetical protein M1137_03680 [Candidatus Parvarchaeota archaeon]|nr:hypothetical protein [Candidatus Parvarchaeota archaeon]
MKLIIKKEEKEKKKINKQFIAAMAFFIVIAVLVYFIAVSINHVSQQKDIAKLNAEAAAYGQQLTSEISANSTACTQNYSFINSSKAKIGCGSVIYCYYSSSCQYSGPQSSNTVSFLCDVFKPNQVIATGMCFKVSLS